LCRSAAGVYSEFGISRGTSLAARALTLPDAGRHNKRLTGFDSIEGPPTHADDEGWGAGWFKSKEGATRRQLREHGVDLDRVTLQLCVERRSVARVLPDFR